MPQTLSYPGVYIEEVPSGVRTITGVATSVTAFIGAAPRGTVGEAVTINSYADFERTFGGLSKDSMLGFAVDDFYRNGGQKAVVVRVFHGDTAAASGTLTVSTLTLIAASPGAWGKYLVAVVTKDPDADVAARLGVKKEDLFNLTIWEEKPDSAGQIARKIENAASIERFLNVTTVESPRRIDRVLKAESSLVRWAQASYTAVATPAEATADATASGAADSGEPNDTDILGGLAALDRVDLFNLLVIPPYATGTSGLDVGASVLSAAASYCEKRRAVFVLDSPSAWTDKSTAVNKIQTGGLPVVSTNAALYFPRYKKPNPTRANQVDVFPVGGVVAGVMARTDTERGVWKAPAGLDAILLGVPELKTQLTDGENGELNPLGVNCLRTMPAAGRVIWGARTTVGSDLLASEWKYVPVRRTALFIEESLYRGTQWVVFEPNDEPLWAQIRLNIGAFMNGMFRQGAFQGKTPRDAYFVKCDKETTTQADIDLGIVNIVVGFAPLKPAEFVVIKIQQIAGQSEA